MKEEYSVFDLHLHTYYSYDCLIHPKKLLKQAVKAGLSHIAVTDHNTIKGALKVREYAKDYPITVYIGTEIHTNFGDLVGLFVDDDIKERRFDYVINEIENQSGLVCLPHPYASHTNLRKMDLTKIHVIEAYNQRRTVHQNYLALKLAKKLCLPIIGGSDAHILQEIGTVKNIVSSNIESVDEMRNAILKSIPKIHLAKCNQSVLPWYQITQSMSFFRKAKYRRFILEMLRLGKNFLSPIFHKE